MSKNLSEAGALTLWRGTLRMALTLALLAASLLPGFGRDLPHTLHIEPYFRGGLQVQVIVPFIITRDECRALVKMYRKQAKGGQVAVIRPIGRDPKWKGPWCRDNFDGRGIVFNDDLYDWEEYRGVGA